MRTPLMEWMAPVVGRVHSAQHVTLRCRKREPSTPSMADKASRWSFSDAGYLIRGRPLSVPSRKHPRSAVVRCNEMLFLDPIHTPCVHTMHATLPEGKPCGSWSIATAALAHRPISPHRQCAHRRARRRSGAVSAWRSHQRSPGEGGRPVRPSRAWRWVNRAGT